MLKKLFVLFLVFFMSMVSAQILGSQLDKTTLALGEVAVFRISITELQDKDVVAAPKNELLPFHFEEISDKIEKQQDSYSRTIEFAVFEEGKFTLPALDFRIGGKMFHTIPYEVEVINTAQKGDKINDIMKNKQVSLTAKDYWQLYKWYVLGFLILLGLIFIIYQIIRYGRKRRSSPVVMTNQTLKELENLRKKQWIEKGNYRDFYVELLDISRKFITKQYRIPADVLLTDDLLRVLEKTNAIQQEEEKVIAEVFLRGDLVKFAKTFPDTETMQADFSGIKTFVKRSVKNLEAEQLRSGV